MKKVRVFLEFSVEDTKTITDVECDVYCSLFKDRIFDVCSSVKVTAEYPYVMVEDQA